MKKLFLVIFSKLLIYIFSKSVVCMCKFIYDIPRYEIYRYEYLQIFSIFLFRNNFIETNLNLLCLTEAALM